MRSTLETFKTPWPNKVLPWTQYLEIIALFFVMGGIFLLPLEHQNTGKWLRNALILTILAGDWKNKLLLIKSAAPIWILLLFMGLLAFGLVYSSAPFSFAYSSGFHRYEALLYGVFLFPLFVRHRVLPYLLWSFIIGLALSDIFNTLYPYLWEGAQHVLIHWRYGDGQQLFDLSLNLSVYNAIAAYICIIKLTLHKKNKILLLSLIGFFLYFMLLVIHERVGLAVTATLLLYLGFKIYGCKGTFLGLILFGAIVIGACTLSSTEHGRVKALFTNAAACILHHQCDSSVGERMTFVDTGIDILSKRPILGHGTGSYATECFKLKTCKSLALTVFDSHHRGKILWWMHAHNTFIMIGVQLGLVGIAVFLVWLIRLWQWGKHLNTFENQLLLQGMLLALIAHGMCDVALMLPTDYLYTILFSVLVAIKYQENNDRKTIRSGFQKNDQN